MLSLKGSSINLDFSEHINEIEDFIENQHNEEAVEKSFKIVEKCFDYLYERLFTTLNLDLQQEIINKIKEDFKGRKFYDLMIGEKLRIFEDFKLLSHLDIHLDKIVNTKELLKLNKLRVDSTHQKRKITKGDATFAYSTVLRFLEKVGYSSFISKSKKGKLEKKVILTDIQNRDYVEFIGREKKIEELKTLLLHKKVHVLSIDGIGGVGKSALALEIAYQLKEEKSFEAIIWVSAKKNRLTYKGVVEIDNSFVNLEDLFDKILKTFKENDFLKLGNFETKQNMVLELLKENHCLIVVDNLETIDDDSIIPFLIDINFPIESKVLITSRKRIGQVEYVVYLKEFNLDETRKYIQSQLKYRSYNGLCPEGIIREIYDKTGGIPLAIKMIIPWIIEGKIRDKLIKEIDEETDILKFCFNRVYSKFLSDEEKKLFCIISIAPAEIDKSALKFISDSKEEKFNESMSHLINYSQTPIF